MNLNFIWLSHDHMCAKVVAQ